MVDYMDSSIITSGLIGGITIIVTVLIAKNQQNRNEYDKKLELKRRIESVFEHPRSYYSSIYGLCGVRVKQKSLSEKEKDELIFEVKQVYNRTTANNLSRILELYEEAQSIDGDINRLLNSRNRVEREKLGEILQEEYENEFCRIPEKNLSYQQGITTIFMPQKEGQTRNEYNFYDLKLELEEKDKEISGEVENLMKLVKCKIKFK